MHAVVKQRKIEDDVKICTQHRNTFFYTRAYQVEFIDRTNKTIIDNIIAKNLFAQVDKEGHRKLLLDKIIDYLRKCDAVHRNDTFVETRTVMRQRKMTTKGWEICVCWKDRSMDWIALKDKKNLTQLS